MNFLRDSLPYFDYALVKTCLGHEHRDETVTGIDIETCDKRWQGQETNGEWFGEHYHNSSRQVFDWFASLKHK